MFTGADVDELDRLSAAFRGAADGTELARQRVAGVARDMSADRMVFGPFAEGYANDLLRDVVAPLFLVQDRLRSFADEVAGHADAQRLASAADGAERPPGVDAIKAIAAALGLTDEQLAALATSDALGLLQGFFLDGAWKSVLEIYYLVAPWTDEFWKFWSWDTWEALKFLATGWATDREVWSEIMQELGVEMFQDFIALEHWRNGEYGRAEGIVLFNLFFSALAITKSITIIKKFAHRLPTLRRSRPGEPGM